MVSVSACSSRRKGHRQRLRRGVKAVAKDRMPQRQHMHAQLMRAPGNRLPGARGRCCPPRTPAPHTRFAPLCRFRSTPSALAGSASRKSAVNPPDLPPAADGPRRGRRTVFRLALAGTDVSAHAPRPYSAPPQSRRWWPISRRCTDSACGKSR